MEEDPYEEGEDIPMRDLDRNDDHDWDLDDETNNDRDSDDQFEDAETDFSEENVSANVDDVTDILSRIEDPRLRQRVTNTISNIQFENSRIEEIELRRILVDSLQEHALEDTDDLDPTAWAETSFIDDGGYETVDEFDRATFLYEQKVGNLNQGLRESGLYIDPGNKEVREFITEHVSEALDLNDTSRIQGYRYDDRLIVLMNESDVFDPIQSPKLKEFFKRITTIQAKKAKSIFREKLATESESLVWNEPREYIEALRETREESIARRSRVTDLLVEVKDMVDDINEDNDTIRAIRQNRSFTFRARIFLRTLGPMMGKLFRFLARHPKVFGSIALSSSIGVVSFIASLYSTRKDLQAAGHQLQKSIKKDLNETTKAVYNEFLGIKKDIHYVENRVKNTIHQTGKTIATQGSNTLQKEIHTLGKRVVAIIIGITLAVMFVILIKRNKK